VTVVDHERESDGAPEVHVNSTGGGRPDPFAEGRTAGLRPEGILRGAEPPSGKLSWEEFEKVDMRVGLVVRAEPFPEARTPAYKLWIDFGPLGEKQSSAQITDHYRPDELVGRQVVCVVNFPPKRIGPFVSEVLVLGAYTNGREVILLGPDREVERGSRVG
jgi:tRNA-binding protein